MSKVYLGWGGYQNCMFGLHWFDDTGGGSIATWGQDFEEGKTEEWKAERDKIYANAMKKLECIMKEAKIDSIEIFDRDVEDQTKQRVLKEIITLVKKEIK